MVLLFACLDALLAIVGVAAAVMLARRQADVKLRAWLLGSLLCMWGGAIGSMLVHHADWVHLFWSAQVPLAAMFLLSGALLMTVWPEDAAFRSAGPTSALERRISSSFHPAWWFLAIVVSLGVTPLFLLASVATPDGRNIGAPLRRVLELARWGCGGALPECLTPITPEDLVRGVGHLPREVTVPTGTILLAAWYWMAFCAIALLGGAIRPPRVRRAFLVLSPALLGTLLLAQSWFATGPNAWFDLPLFTTERNSGVWKSHPAVLRSFGPTLCGACFAAILLGVLLWRRHGVVRRVLASRAR